jgi:dihydroorotate dehydrogenase (NAD+) catalytic subunit
VWGSAVGNDEEEFAMVAAGLAAAGVAAVEVNLSCPNLSGHGLIAFDPAASARVVKSVAAEVSIPIGAKLAPNAPDIAAVAGAVADAGAHWVVVGNTALGAAIDIETRRPRISGYVGGYSGPPLKPISLRCVVDVRAAHPDLPVVGCGGVMRGEDVIEYLMAGANAVGVGTAHFAEPRVGKRLLREVVRWCERHDVGTINELVGAVRADG